ncbi:MAG TPA: outer membrane protein assembly factor BamD [Candidatus Cloacimonadota bacterium]|nr:outer membrane protein assembly factor BamD [Candidatus Cloacimonadota bacterium]HPS38494.1 outer membrane protein assembly factor BamD [Candidatus Cloacimonadota bacterium]
MKRSLIIVTLIIMGLTACSRNVVYKDVTDKVAAADSLFNAKKYARAAVLYDEVSFERKSGQTAYALMRLADSYFAVNRFTDARQRYEQFTKTFPQHTDVNRAMYQIAVCYYEESLPAQYDQTLTLNCIDAFRNFVLKYPSDPMYSQAVEYVRKAQFKLIQKKYLNGYIYYMMKDYSSALMYFSEVTELGNTDELDRLSHYYSGKILREQKNIDGAKLHLLALQDKYPDSKETRKLSQKLK